MFNKLLKEFTMLDCFINYGRHLIENFLISAGNYETVLDLGAGSGDDLSIAREINLAASLHAIECYPEYIQKLELQSIDVCSINKDVLNFLPSCFPGGYQLKAFGGSNFYPFPPVIAARPLARLFPTMAWGIFCI